MAWLWLLNPLLSHAAAESLASGRRRSLQECSSPLVSPGDPGENALSRLILRQGAGADGQLPQVRPGCPHIPAYPQVLSGREMCLSLQTALICSSVFVTNPQHLCFTFSWVITARNISGCFPLGVGGRISLTGVVLLGRNRLHWFLLGADIKTKQGVAGGPRSSPFPGDLSSSFLSLATFRTARRLCVPTAVPGTWTSRSW